MEKREFENRRVRAGKREPESFGREQKKDKLALSVETIQTG